MYNKILNIYLFIGYLIIYIINYIMFIDIILCLMISYYSTYIVCIFCDVINNMIIPSLTDLISSYKRIPEYHEHYIIVLRSRRTMKLSSIILPTILLPFFSQNLSIIQVLSAFLILPTIISILLLVIILSINVIFRIEECFNRKFRPYIFGEPNPLLNSHVFFHVGPS